METFASRRLFTVDEYTRMAEAGVFGAEDRVELVGGEVFRMPLIGARHIGCVIRMTDAFAAAFRGRAIVSPQLPLRLDEYSEPEPDLALLKTRADYYSSRTPQSGDAVLVVEVSDTSRHYDYHVKLPRYAVARIPEVWIADLGADLLRVCREPSGDSYDEVRAFDRDDQVSVAAFPDVSFRVGDLLG